MEESRFEKQVKDKMDELKIQPSDAVWENIELRIEKKKKEKWGFGFWLLIFLSIGSFLLWNISQKNVSDSKALKTIREEAITKKAVSSENRDNNKVLANDKNIHAKRGTISENDEDNYQETGSTVNKKNNLSRLKGSEKSNTSISVLQIKPKDEPDEIVLSNAESKKQNHGKITSEIKNGNAAEVTKEPDLDNFRIVDSTPILPLTDSLIKLTSTVKRNKINDTSASIAKTSNQIRSNKSKWKFGMMFMPGFTFSNVSLTEFNNSSFPYLSGYIASLPQNNRAVYTYNSRPGFGFATGFLAEKNISAKTILAIGVNYKSLAVTNILSDSIQNASQTIDRFNFIELPVSVKIQMGNSKKIPLFWQGGISLSQLVNYKKLQYSFVSNTPHFSLNTGLMATLFSNKQFPFSIGPNMYYDLTKIANKGLYDTRHLVFAAVQMQFILGNKLTKK